MKTSLPPTAEGDAFWLQVMAVLLPSGSLQPVQRAALDAGLLGIAQRKHFIVSAPTNGGKTLVGDLACIDALRQGERAVILEPLRALAQEKADDWAARAENLSKVIERPVTVTLSTGDYRLEDEQFTDAPQAAHVTVATPEKLEALLRRPEHQAWFDGIGVVVVDEAHLLSNPRRGPTLELLLARLKALAHPPRFVLLSGTVGSTAAVEQWLNPCEVVRVTERTSPLTLSVLPASAPQEANDLAAQWLAEALHDPAHRALVFVYQTASAGKMAGELNTVLGAGTALPYHAQMAKAQREATKAAFLRGECRVIVTTTALAMGLNLPCTHVLVRDTTFAGVGRLDVAELLQMLGRAGRGQTPGTGAVLWRPSDGWGEAELRQALTEPQFLPLVSAFDMLDPADPQPVMQMVATLLAAQVSSIPAQTLETLLQNSLGGRHLSGQVRRALGDLVRHKLAFSAPPPEGTAPQEEHFKLTWLGRHAVQSVIPLPVAAGYSQLQRDLMSVDARDDLLEQWRPMDTLLLINLLHDRPPNLGWRWSEALPKAVDAWCERFGADAPKLYEFVRGDAEQSRADELLGSLGVPLPSGRKAKGEARKLAYQALARAAILYERSKGRAITDIERTWGIKNLSGAEERWRDDLLWLLGGLSDLMDVNAFLYHLKQNLQADDVRVKRVRLSLQRQQRQVYGLIEGLKRCSPLGGLLDSIRKQQLGRKPKIGLATIKRLEDAGVTSINELQGLTADQLQALGVRRDFAQQLLKFLKRQKST